MSHHDDEVSTNTSNNPHMSEIIEQVSARRGFLKAGLGLASIPFVSGTLAACSGSSGSAEVVPAALPTQAAPTLGFSPTAKSLADAVIVPAGYSVKAMYRLGDPLAASITEYRNDGTDSAASFALRAGDHHDGIQYFGLDAAGQYHATASDRALLWL